MFDIREKMPAALTKDEICAILDSVEHGFDAKPKVKYHFGSLSSIESINAEISISTKELKALIEKYNAIVDNIFCLKSDLYIAYTDEEKSNWQIVRENCKETYHALADKRIKAKDCAKQIKVMKHRLSNLHRMNALLHIFEELDA